TRGRRPDGRAGPRGRSRHSLLPSPVIREVRTGSNQAGCGPRGKGLRGAQGPQRLATSEVIIVGLAGVEHLADSIGVTRGQRHPRGDAPATELARGRRCDETAGTDHGPGVTGAALVDEVRGVDDPGLVLGLGVEVGLLDHLPGGGYSLVVAEGAQTVE